MSSLHLILIIGAAVLMLLFVILMLPSSDNRKKHKTHALSLPPQKDWQAVALGLERHIHALKIEVEELKVAQKNKLKDIAVEKAKNAKLQEKILQEKQWLDKEDSALHKKEAELTKLKSSLTAAQTELEQEHFLKLKLEQQFKGLKDEYEGLQQEKKELSARLMRAESITQGSQEELSKQKKANAVLSQKIEETDWIAKAEYDRVVKLLREKEKELERLSREQNQ